MARSDGEEGRWETYSRGGLISYTNSQNELWNSFQVILQLVTYVDPILGFHRPSGTVAFSFVRSG